MSKKPNEEKKTYILTLREGGLRKLTIPATWKLTYGSLAPYQKATGYDDRSKTFALRVYEGSEKNLRAVFNDVVAIRDASIEISEKRTSVKRQMVQKATANGARDVQVEARISEWVNPDSEESDSVDNDFLKIGNSEIEF